MVWGWEDPLQGKRQTTYHRDTDTTRTARKKNEGGGVQWGPRGSQLEQATATTSEPHHNRRKNRTHRPSPRDRRRVCTGKARHKHPQHLNKKRQRGAPPPTATPTQPPTADGITPPQPGRDRQPPRSKKGGHTGQGKPSGQVRDRQPLTRQLHTPAGEKPAHRRAPGQSQPGPHTAQPEQ